MAYKTSETWDQTWAVWVHECMLLFGKGREMPSTQNTQSPQWNVVVEAKCFGAVSGTENLVRVHEIIKRWEYVDILLDNVKKSSASLALGHRWVFQQYSGIKPTAKCVQMFFKYTKSRSCSGSLRAQISILLSLWRELKIKLTIWVSWSNLPWENWLQSLMACANIVRNHHKTLLSAVNYKGHAIDY